MWTTEERQDAVGTFDKLGPLRRAAIPMSKQCPNCGSQSRALKQGNYVFTPPPNIPGGPMVVKDAAWEECQNCGQQLLSPALSRALEELSIQRQGLLSPGKIKSIREKLGLTQTVMAERLGVGEKTYTRWESSRSIQNRSSDNLIRLMDRAPEQFSFVEAQRNPERSTKIADYFNKLGQHDGRSQLAMAAHIADLEPESAERIREALCKAAQRQNQE
jgi:putative zinc finger/helix-turn-helix YgiT family protein